MRRRFALAGIGLLFGLVIAEIGLRVLLPPMSLQAIRGMYREDPDAAYRMRPGFEMGAERLNSDGFRGPDLPSEPASGERRIAAFGDSYMFGLGLPAYEMTFPARLEALMNGAGARPVRVFGFGTPGYCTLQSFRIYRAERDRLLRRLAPDTILLGFYYGNDAHDNASGNLYVSVIDGNIATYRPSWVRRVLDPLLGSLAVYSWGRELYRRARPLWQGPPPAWERRMDSIQADVFATLRTDLADTGDWGRGWKETERILEEWKAAADEDSAAFVVVGLPDLLQVDSALLRKVAAQKGVPLDCVDDRLPNRRLAAILQRLGIPFIDATMAFEPPPRKPEDDFIPLDGHYSEAGIERVAEYASRRL